MVDEVREPSLAFRAASDAQALARKREKVERLLGRMAAARGEQARRDVALDLAREVRGIELLGEALRHGKRELLELLEAGRATEEEARTTLELAEKPQAVRALQHAMPGSFGDAQTVSPATALRVKVARSPQHYHVNASTESGDAVGLFTEEDLTPLVKELPRIGEWIEGYPEKGEKGPREDGPLRMFGGRLFSLLFARDTLTFFEAWQRARSLEHPLLVFIEFDETSHELDQLPWELMAWKDSFLLVEHGINVVRLAGSSLLTGRPVIEGPVTTVLIASDPLDADSRGMAPIPMEQE